MSGGADARIVAYADKRAAQRLQPLAARFARWRRRHPDAQEFFERAWPRALELEQRVCRDAGIDPRGVRRLHWARRALTTAGAPATEGPER
ncbi:MAG: hypothetical protein ACXVAP_03705 [Candidatus Limnocylindrales bacterium]